MLSKVKVKILKEDIENGVRALCSHCPLALAVSRTLGGRWYIDGDAWQFGDRQNTLHTLPEEVIDWIRSYDRGLPVKPITFEMTKAFSDAESGS